MMPSFLRSAAATTQMTQVVAVPQRHHHPRVCVIVTGASRGLGRAIAVTLCRLGMAEATTHNDNTGPQRRLHTQAIHAVLVARSSTGMRVTANEILSGSRTCNGSGATKTQVTVSSVEADLSDLTTLDDSIDRILQECMASSCAPQKQASSSTAARTLVNFDTLIFINNAGTLGPLGPIVDKGIQSSQSTSSLFSLRDVQTNVDLNVTGALWMSTRIARWADTLERIPVDSTTSPAETASSHVQSSVSTTIVNISSLCAVQPTSTMALYSAGKAARDSYHVALAAELQAKSTEPASSSSSSSSPLRSNTNNSCIRILNYAPGPLETDMATTLRQTPSLDESLKPHFHKTLVDPMDSAAVLCRLLFRQDSFESGAHVDYYDCLSDSKPEMGPTTKDDAFLIESDTGMRFPQQQDQP